MGAKRNHGDLKRNHGKSCHKHEAKKATSVSHLFVLSCENHKSADILLSGNCKIKRHIFRLNRRNFRRKAQPHIYCIYISLLDPVLVNTNISRRHHLAGWDSLRPRAMRSGFRGLGSRPCAAMCAPAGLPASFCVSCRAAPWSGLGQGRTPARRQPARTLDGPRGGVFACTPTGSPHRKKLVFVFWMWLYLYVMGELLWT